MVLTGRNTAVIQFFNVLRPSVVYCSGTYYLFYADETAIGLATSTNPQGPFTDQA